MLNPKFPYLGNQAIISSGRVTTHAKDDAVFIFGKQGVGISTPATFNVDAPEKTIINSNIIELGLRAKTEGYRVIKGEIMLQQLNMLLDSLTQLSVVVDAVAAAAVDVSDIVPLSIQLSSVRDRITTVKNQLNANSLSNTTFTK